MQFTSIIATLSMVLAATALPSPNAPAGNSCTGNSKVACCSGTTGGLLLGGNCDLDIIDALTCALSGGKQACCQTNDAGLIVVDASCAQIL